MVQHSCLALHCIQLDLDVVNCLKQIADYSSLTAIYSYHVACKEYLLHLSFQSGPYILWKLPIHVVWMYIIHASMVPGLANTVKQEILATWKFHELGP